MLEQHATSSQCETHPAVLHSPLFFCVPLSLFLSLSFPSLLLSLSLPLSLSLSLSHFLSLLLSLLSASPLPPFYLF